MIQLQQHINVTQNWLKTVVIDLNFCPFAGREYERGSIDYVVLESSDTAGLLEALINNCIKLDQSSEIETSLLIIPNALNDFNDYLDFLAMANELLIQQGYEGVYQLASFHPDYLFEGVDADDASHYTNRSPYPMIHLLRETSLEKALAHYPNPESIPENNIKKTREMGVESLKLLLKNCTE